jgi:predicted O-methyltransferase YrrM
MNPVIEQIYATRSVKDGEGRTINPFPDSIPYGEGETVYRLIRTVQPEATLEIGMAYGLSTLFMCQALVDNGHGRHIAIDPFQTTQWKSIGLRNVQRAKLDRVLTFRESRSHEMLPRLLEQGQRLKVVFIDGCHLLDYTLLEFFYADQMLDPGGFLVMDDLWMPAIRKVCGFVLRNRRYRLAVEHLRDSASLWQRGVRLARSLGQHPFDLHALGMAGRLVVSGAVRYCVLQKTADDARPWRHYRSF